MNITDTPSPNFNDRRHALNMLVLHYTGMETGEAALARMCDPAAEVSAHYMVWEDGRIVKLVAEDKRAWHAGVSSWQGDADLNSRSIGIEIVNGGHDWPLPDGTLPPYPDAQIEAVIALSSDILSRHPIPPTRIVGHSDIAPSRKADPGEHFPWSKLAEAGIGLWPERGQSEIGPHLIGYGLLPGDTGPPVARVQARLIEMGYPLEETARYDTATTAALRAFQQRFLPERVSGYCDLATLARLEQVASAYSVTTPSDTSGASTV